MEYGKKVRVRNFYIMKFVKTLSKNEVKKLRKAAGIPEEVQKHLSRGKLPFIKVSSAADVWSVEFAAGSSMYNALDALSVVHDGDGVNQLYGVEEKNAFAMFVAMYADTSTVGDTEYNVGKQKLLSEYVERVSKARVEADTAGKSDEEQRAESDAAVAEVSDRERHEALLVDIASELSSEAVKREEV